MENEVETDEFQPPVRSLYRTGLKIVVATISFFVIVLLAGYWLTQQKPAFYQAAMQTSEQEAFTAGESLEVAALYLRNDVVEEESWVAEFPEDQINGWLASDLPRKFAAMMPEEIQDPRVAIDPGTFQLALRTKIMDTETVVVAATDFFPTEVPNQFEVRIFSVHAGWLPIPITFFTQPATDLLVKHRIQVEWYDDSEGYPVALLTFPARRLSYQGQHIVIEQLELAEQSIRLAGRSEPLVKNTPQISDDVESDADDKSTSELNPIDD